MTSSVLHDANTLIATSIKAKRMEKTFDVSSPAAEDEEELTYP